ncbi:endonuclease 2 isoform X3 [Lathyrus oleraceus]|uniref:endonuclease 2 isoform X3 n=1 Tax=Pisum sativum TaxID=3888 RepID=UPI0021CEB4EF|nr:endonuclease 2-like isoform X3 [Pisum sativum]
MECNRIQLVAILSFIFLVQSIQGWGEEGHAITCKIAQARLTDAAADAVKQLLPAYANNDLSSVCTWADRVKFALRWTSALHYADTPPKLCNFQYARDCKDLNGVKDRCVVGAINNYTTQLLDYGKDTQHNLTQALLFLSHYMGDVHQPLHTGFTTDKGGNTIDVHWYTRKQNLHHVWDANIIETAEERFYDNNIDEYFKDIQKNITKTWSDEVADWEACSSDETTCPNVYASEGVKDACQYAYKDAPEDATLEDDYFLSRLPIISLRLAQGGVRLAATLNRIFQ